MRQLIIATTVLITAASATSVLAEPSCNVATAEWQSEQALRDKLTVQKWTIKNIKIDNGCYEVYGTDDKGKRVEIYFDPKSLEAVPGQEG